MARCFKSVGITSLTYGMNGLCAMEMGFEGIFPIHNGCSGVNIHLRCFDHVQNDIDQKLLGLKVIEAERKAIISDILGQENRGIRTMGLVDCAINENFEQRFVKLEKKWTFTPFNGNSKRMHVEAGTNYCRTRRSTK